MRRSRRCRGGRKEKEEAMPRYNYKKFYKYN
jgi:hypothetical protein